MATVCEHCHSPMQNDEDGVFREGYSYHSECHKCYVCSNPDVDEAEIFKGVIFCGDCSRRIFQEYSVISRVKGRSLTRQNPRLVDVLFTRNSPGLVMGERDVIERVRIPNNLKRNILLEEILKKISVSEMPTKRSFTSMKSKRTASDYAGYAYSKDAPKQQLQDDVEEEFIRYDEDDIIVNKASRIESVVSDANIEPLSSKSMIKHYENDIENVYSMKSLVDDDYRSIKSTVSFKAPNPDGVLNVASNKKRLEKVGREEKKSIRNCMRKMQKSLVKTDDACSDMRMAEFGTSLEMASLALKNKSNESSFDMRASLSTLSSKNPFSASIVEMYSASAGPTHSIQESSRGFLDKRLRSLLKMPFTSFKKKIWDSSSLVKMLMENPELEEPNVRRLMSRLRTAPSCVQIALAKPKYYYRNKCHRKTVQHQGRGLRKLYTTIQRKSKPCKLGWPSLESKRHRYKKSGDYKRHHKRCKHFVRSHSYRCMRRQVMRLAGPTQEQLIRCRTNILELLLPKIIKQFLPSAKNPSVTNASNAALKQIFGPTFNRFSEVPLHIDKKYRGVFSI